MLSRFFGVTGVWLYFLTGETLTLLLTALLVWKQNRAVTLAPQAFLLLRKSFGVRPEDLMEIDIRSLADVDQATRQAESFCLRHGQSPKMSNHIALCVEEMASNTVIHGFDKKGGNHLSVRIQNKGSRWILRFRDDCSAFDPVSYVPRGEEDALGLRLVTAMADDLRYTYSLNLNNLTIRLTR